MNIKGSRTIAAPRERVYAALQDGELLRRTLPGCRSLDETAPDVFTMRVEMGVGAIKGAYDGTVKLENLRPPDGYDMRVDASGAMGVVNAVAHVALTDAASGGTDLAYDADATVGGLVAGVGQRMIAGVAKVVIDQFFKSFDKELTKTGV